MKREVVDMILNGSGFDHFISFESTRSYVCTVSLTGFAFEFPRFPKPDLPVKKMHSNVMS